MVCDTSGVLQFLHARGRKHARGQNILKDFEKKWNILKVARFRMNPNESKQIQQKRPKSENANGTPTQQKIQKFPNARKHPDVSGHIWTHLIASESIQTHLNISEIFQKPLKCFRDLSERSRAKYLGWGGKSGVMSLQNILVKCFRELSNSPFCFCKMQQQSLAIFSYTIRFLLREFFFCVWKKNEHFAMFCDCSKTFRRARRRLSTFNACAWRRARGSTSNRSR